MATDAARIWRRRWWWLAFAGVQALLLAGLSAWLLQRAPGQSPGLHADSVLFVPAASRCAEGECGRFAVYLRLFLSRDPPRWDLDLHGQAYPALLAAIARSPDYAALVDASRWVTVAVGWLTWLAVWLRAGSSWAGATTALPVALAIALVSMSHAGRPEQLVPVVCAVAWMLRALPRWRRSAAGFGAEVGVIAWISPAPAIIGGMLYLWVLVASTPPAALAARGARFASAAVATWFAITLWLAPFPPWVVLRETLSAYAGARGAAPTGLGEAMRMLAIHPDVPGVGLAWVLFAVVATVATVRHGRAHPAAWPWAAAALCALGGVVIALALHVYTAQYNLVCVSLALATALQALPAASVPAARASLAALLLVMSLPALALWTAPPATRVVHGAAVRAAVQPALAKLGLGHADRILTLESDAVLWMAEPRPLHFLVAQDASAATFLQLDASIDGRVCWMLSAQSPPGVDHRVAWRSPAGEGHGLALYVRDHCPEPQGGTRAPPAQAPQWICCDEQ